MSVRLDAETEARIRQIARAAGKSKSWVVREAVAAYGSDRPAPRTPYEALSPFIGAGGTGESNLSERTGDRFTGLVQARASRRAAAEPKRDGRRRARARRPR